MKNDLPQRVDGIAAAVAAIAAIAAIAGCAAKNPRPAGAPASAGPAVDASYDWHVLIVAPFGMRLRESPLPVHEVLLFRDASSPDGDAEHHDCYAVERAPPRFVGRRPDAYTWCFDHDRLTRIEASVELNAVDAARVFSTACAVWLKGAATPPAADRCDGQAAGTAFSGRLAAAPDGASMRLSMMLVPTDGGEDAGTGAAAAAVPHSHAD